MQFAKKDFQIVATREGEVFQRLFDKLEVQRKALGGRVFDVLGEAFDGVSLKDLLIEAIRYGEREDVKLRQKQVIDGVLDTKHIQDIMKRNALVEQHSRSANCFSTASICSNR